MANYQKISNIKKEAIQRIRCGYNELDWLFGHTTFSNGVTNWGMPSSKITLLSGKSGAGKSRLAIAMAKRLSTGCKVLYFQQESSLSDFRSWVKGNDYNPDNFYCSDADTMKDQLLATYEINPLVIFVDSINEVKDFGTGTKGSVNNVIHLYRQLFHYGSRAHIILLGQLNQDGSIKGSTTLPHLVDIALTLEPLCPTSTESFVVKIGVKHRYGPRGKKYMTIWDHTDEGVKSVSQYSLEDPVWCETHGLQVKSPWPYDKPKVRKYSVAQSLKTLFLGR